jgi:DNA (cytosine-5)-methyltransferase 1
MSLPTRTAISLYTGAGGLDLGFEHAGFISSVCVELDADCCRTLRANRAWPIIERDITTVPSTEILDIAGLNQGDADILIGGPPCQPFSKSSYWVNGDTKRLEDPRSNTLGEYMRVLEDCLPKTFLLENVPGLTYAGKDEGFRLLVKQLEDVNRRQGTNYSLRYAKLNAADFGVPQIRERVFLIGSRDGRSFTFPDARFGLDTSDSTLFPLPRYRNAWDAIGDLDGVDCDERSLQVTGKWADLLPSIPEGENYLWHTDRGGGEPLFRWRARYWSFLLKLAKARPSWTIQAQPGSAIGPFHWNNRRLTMREMARLQTFPDDYVVLGGRQSMQKQIGNAVPSALAEVLALEIRRQLLGDQCSSESPTLIPKGTPTPRPEPVRPVPDKYLNT